MSTTVPDRSTDSRRQMTAGGGGAPSPDKCTECGHSNLNKYCDCCQNGHR